MAKEKENAKEEVIENKKNKAKPKSKTIKKAKKPKTKKLSPRALEWTQPEKLTLIEGWARDGLTDEQIAKNMGITRTTLFEWRKLSPYISNALKKGKEVVDYEVVGAMVRSAMGYNVKLEKQVKLKTVTYIDGNRHEKEELVTVYEETHVPANVTAQIFWLKNRKPEDFKDRVDVADVTDYETVTIVNDIE